VDTVYYYCGHTGKICIYRGTLYYFYSHGYLVFVTILATAMYCVFVIVVSTHGHSFQALPLPQRDTLKATTDVFIATPSVHCYCVAELLQLIVLNYPKGQI